MKYGIDVSMFIEPVDLEQYDPDFVIIRSGEGGLRDAKTEFYAAQCKTKNIQFGFYHLLRLSGYTLEENIRSLEDAIKKCGRPSFGIWCDVETDDAFNNEAIGAFCKHFQDKGIYSGIYAGVNQFRTGKINLPEYDKWVAYYGADTGDLNDFQDWEVDIISNIGSLWQYHGSNNDPDLNICFHDDLSIYRGVEDSSTDVEQLKLKIKQLRTLIDDIEKGVNKL